MEAVERLQRLKRRVGEYYWFGLYQQLPRSTVGKGRVSYAFDGLNVAEARRLFVHPDCRHTITGLEKLTYRPGTNLIKKGRWDHLTDALGYLIHQEFPLYKERTVMNLIREMNAADRG